MTGLRVVVTRASHQAADLVAAFKAAGARVEALPLLQVVAPEESAVALERAASELALYHWLVFTSANAVDAFLPLAGGSLPPGLKVAVVGHATAKALSDWQVKADLVAPRADAEGLAMALRPHVGRRRRVLLPQAADARPHLARRLGAAGAEVSTVTAYDKRLPPAAREQARVLFRNDALGWVTFTSPRIVQHFVAVLEPHWAARRHELLAASIGPVTTAELRGQGVTRIAQAAQPGDRHLVEAVIRAVQNQPNPG